MKVVPFHDSLWTFQPCQHSITCRITTLCATVCVGVHSDHAHNNHYTISKHVLYVTPFLTFSPPLKNSSLRDYILPTLLISFYSLAPSFPPPPSPLSPPPPSQICVHVALSAVVAYSKVSLVVLLHAQTADRDSALFLVGVAIQLGAVCGAVLFFCLVYYTALFNSG